MPGGVVLFAGGRDPLEAGPGAVLTLLIDAMTKFGFSHTALAMPAAGVTAPYIHESTIRDGVSGPQRSDLNACLAECRKQGGHARLFPFLPQFEPDWADAEAAALQLISEREQGRMPYNVERLFADAEERSWVFDVVALPADGVISYLAAHSKGIVYSEMVGLLAQAGGVVARLTAVGIPGCRRSHHQASR